MCKIIKETYCISIRVLRSLKDVFVVQPGNLVSEFQILSNNHLVIYMKKDRSRLNLKRLFQKI